MQTNTLQTEIIKKGANIEKIVQRVVREPHLLQEAFDGLAADKVKVKYGCLKLLRLLSETKPDILYPEIGRLFLLFDSENNIFKWGAIIIIGNLAAVDSERKIDEALDRYRVV
jgi:hypothetical protein